MKERWGLYLCRCDGALPLDEDLLGRAAPLCHVAAGADADPAAFVAEAREQGVTRVLTGCCRGREPLEDAFAQAGWMPDVFALDLRETCFRPHADAGGANAKALRMLRGEMRAASRREDVPEVPLEVAGHTLLATDRPAGYALAARLEAQGPLVVLLEGEDTAWEGVPLDKVNRGRLTEVRGRLGKLGAVIEPQSGNGTRAAEARTVAVAQVVVARGGGVQDLPGRTGVHRLDADDAEALAAVPGAVAELTGTFMKPVAVRYEQSICAGGAASHPACGRCIERCPYDAIARAADNPLRVAVDHLACEGCGGCTAACPTGALAFTDPNPAQLYDRMAAMLSPPRGQGGEPGAAPVAVLYCPEQGRAALEHVAAHPWQDGAGLLPVEVPCLRHVSTATMLAALRLGAAGVALLGCGDCLHGGREQLEQDLELTGRILDAFGLGAGRVRLFTTEPDSHGEVLGALERFAADAEPTGMRYEGVRYRGGGNREVMAEALTAIIAHTGKEPGGLELKGDAPYALALVNEDGCTLCRSCANVCPSHAFRFNEAAQELSFKHIDCVGCGLCAKACPENVVTLRSELYLEREGMQPQVLVRDEPIPCAKCGKPYINRRALDTIEGRVLGMESLLDTFQGRRKDILRMCPDCRGVAAVWEVEQGWEP